MTTTQGRSPQFVGAALVVVAVVWFGLLFWIATHSSGLRWLLFSIGTIAVIIGAVVVFSRRTERAPQLRSAATPDDDFWRVLVVVDDGGTSEEFRKELLEAAQGRPTKAFVVAPALSSRLDQWTGDQAAYDEASNKLNATLDALGAIGVDAQGRIGAHDPLQATADGLTQFPADTIILATHPESEANWLERGVVEEVRSQTNIPVEHVVVASDETREHGSQTEPGST
jgi:hypothetical protein